MKTRDTNSLDPTSEAILGVQRELLIRLGSELLAAQRAALASVQAEMQQTSRELAERIASWRRRAIGLVSFSTGLLVPWLVLLSLLGVATFALSAKARSNWSDYQEARAAAERLRIHGAITVVRDGQLYVRVDPDSLAQGKLGNWYARAVSLELREPGESTER